MSSWFRLDCMHTHVPCTHSDTLTFNAVLHIGGNDTKSEFYIYMYIYPPLIFFNLVFALQLSNPLRGTVFFMSLGVGSPQSSTHPFFLLHLKFFLLEAAELILLQFSLATSCPPQCNNCTFIHLQSPFQFLGGFYDLQDF